MRVKIQQMCSTVSNPSEAPEERDATCFDSYRVCISDDCCVPVPEPFLMASESIGLQKGFRGVSVDSAD